MENSWDDLWSAYLESFLQDDHFLCATLLDPRNGCGRNLNWSLAKKSKGALLKRFERAYSHQEENISRNKNVPCYSEPEQTELSSELLADNIVATLFGSSPRMPGNASPSKISYNTPEEELRALFEAVQEINLFRKWLSHPFLPMALSLLSMPAGKPPS